MGLFDYIFSGFNYIRAIERATENQYKGIKFIGRKEINLKKHYIGYRYSSLYCNVPEDNAKLTKKGYKIKGWLNIPTAVDDMESESFVPVFYRRKNRRYK